jgi:hypothetical protein
MLTDIAKVNKVQPICRGRLQPQFGDRCGCSYSAGAGVDAATVRPSGLRRDWTGQPAPAALLGVLSLFPSDLLSELGGEAQVQGKCTVRRDVKISRAEIQIGR